VPLWYAGRYPARQPPLRRLRRRRRLRPRLHAQQPSLPELRRHRLSRAEAAASPREFGEVQSGVNAGHCTDHMPCGGTKDSGQGREGVRYAIEEMTEPKIMVMAEPGG
jgi:hypothetical protein